MPGRRRTCPPRPDVECHLADRILARRTDHRYLAAILILSVLLRIGVAVYLGDVVDAPPLLTDQRSYHALGARLIAGQGFSFDRGWYPFTPPDTPTSHWSFLYSLFVAAVYLVFGVHPLAVRLAQAVLGGLLLPWLVHRLTRRVLEPPRYSDVLPLVAALLASIYAYLVLYAATMMTETFYIAALLWVLERTLAFAENPGARHGIVVGVGLGIATLLRQSILPWVVVMFAWLLWNGYYRRRLRRSVWGLLAAVLVLALLLSPFTIRNYRVYGQFLLLNSNAGYAMYSAQHPMHGTNFREFDAAPIPPELRGLNEAQLDRELMRLGIGFVLAEPYRYLLLCLSRVRAYFEFWPTPDTTWLHNLGRVGSFALLLPFMLYGFLLAWRQARPRRASSTWQDFSVEPLALILLFILFYSLMHVLTWAMPRYRLPVDTVALPFASLGLARLAVKPIAHLLQHTSLRALIARPYTSHPRGSRD